MKFPVIYRVRDDYGISSAAMVFKLPYEESERKISIKTGSMEKDETNEYLWDLSDFQLLPEDVVPYHLIVYDNDTVGGPKAGISETRIVRLPSMTDIFADVIDDENAGIERLRDISERAADQETRLDEIGQSIKNGEDIEWSDTNALDEARQNLQQMQKEVKDISEDIRHVSDTLSEENIVAFETLEKLENISDIMESIAEGEMKDALKQLLTAHTEIDPKKVKEALDNYNVTAEDIQKKLDRIISLLEQVKTLQRFEMAKNLLEELAVKQAEVTAEYHDNPDNTLLAREEEMLAGEMETIGEELLAAIEELEEQFKLDAGKFKDAVRSNNASQTMQQASRQMSDGASSEAEESLTESNTMISQLLEQMDQLDAIMKNSNTEEMRAPFVLIPR